MATRLNQLISTSVDTKSRADAALTEAHRTLAKAPLLSGLTRSYTPLDDEGEALPGEGTRVQVSATNVLADVATALGALFDATGSLEATNASAAARANVVVNGETLIENATVPFLLSLTKKLVDIRTFIAALPTLDAANTWILDETEGVYRSEAVQTTRTKKVPRAFEKSPATEKHPAQVEVFHEDIVVGTWTATKFSGALPIARVRVLTARVDALIAAVKVAREEANSATVVEYKVGDAITAYLFG